MSSSVAGMKPLGQIIVNTMTGISAAELKSSCSDVDSSKFNFKSWMWSSANEILVSAHCVPSHSLKEICSATARKFTEMRHFYMQDPNYRQKFKTWKHVSYHQGKLWLCGGALMSSVFIKIPKLYIHHQVLVIISICFMQNAIIQPNERGINWFSVLICYKKWSDLLWNKPVNHLELNCRFLKKNMSHKPQRSLLLLCYCYWYRKVLTWV